GDADGSYDFSSIGTFVDKLRQGNDFVMGNRFKGGIQPGAMPWKNQWIGTPALSRIANLFYRTGIGDVNCGLRAFTKPAFVKMNLQTTGMEFASEMVVKASLHRLRIAEVPTILLPPSPVLSGLYRYVRLETGLLLGGLATLVGLAGVLIAAIAWSRVGFQQLDPDTTMRQLIPAVVLLSIGVQTVFASFFLSMLGLHTSQRGHLEAGVNSDR